MNRPTNRSTCWLAFAAAVMLVGLPAATPAAVQHKKVTYCTRHHHPRGCVAVPKSAKRPRNIRQQGATAPTPSDIENGGGLGGGPGNHRDGAISWAQTQRDFKRWAWRCERFVEEAYGTRGQFATAIATAAKLDLHPGSVRAAPRGSLVFFAADTYNQHFGHVGLSLGNGKMLSALRRVRTTDITHSAYWRKLYIGWADAPVTWPGRIPRSPGPTTADPDASVRITAPAPGQTVGGAIQMLATATGAGGVAFDAYYATDPRDPNTRGWHPIGIGTPQRGSWALEWNTASVPDQGFGPWGTVNIAATVLDTTGQRTGTRDYRRVSIDNATGSMQPITPDGYPETTGGASNTWTDYTNAGGTQGSSIGGFATVRVACKITGFKVSDGNTWWYRLASSPWNGMFYASADGFYNNGQTSGTLHGTPFVDPAVPDCP
jgi:hypothetical protein